MKPGGPYELVAQHILGRRNVTQRVHDVLFGDVWLCSGQSNMQMTVSQVICRVSVKINSVDVEEEEKKWREEGARRRERNLSITCQAFLSFLPGLKAEARA